MNLILLYSHFNCTIQELKLSKKFFVLVILFHFNCTIQELKLDHIEKIVFIC